MKIKLCSAFLLLTLSALLFSGCYASGNDFDSFAMGSVLSAKIYGDKTLSREIFDKVNGAAAETDSLLSATVKDSDISLINRNGYVIADPHTKKVLTSCLVLCNICGGAVDPTVGAVSELWGFASDEPSKPSDEAIAGALPLVDITGVLMSEDTNRISVRKGQKLDLGAFGKGAALDAARNVLLSYPRPAVVTLGGTVLVYGKCPSGKWKIGIRDPFGSPNDAFAELSFKNEQGKAMFLSTSGSYEKCFEEDGVTYHHILSVETGYPVETDLVSVTVTGGSGLVCDGLSTACFIGGLNKETLGWLKDYSCEAVFVFSDGTYYVTEGLKDSFRLTGGSSFSEHAYEN